MHTDDSSGTGVNPHTRPDARRPGKQKVPAGRVVVDRPANSIPYRWLQLPLVNEHGRRDAGDLIEICCKQLPLGGVVHRQGRDCTLTGGGGLTNSLCTLQRDCSQVRK